MSSSRGQIKKKFSRKTGTEPEVHTQGVVVIDDLSIWRDHVSQVLRNHDYLPLPFCDLSTATTALEKWDARLALEGICLELNLGIEASSSIAEATLPEIHLFLDMIRNRFRTVPLLIMCRNEGEGFKTANELNSDGLRAVVISKDAANFTKSISDTIGKVLGGKPITGAGPTLPMLSPKQKSDLVIVSTLVCGLVFACTTGALSTWLLRASGIAMIGSLLAFVTLVFSLSCLFALTQTGALPANILKQCMEVLLRALNPLNALKHFKRDRSKDNETK